MSEKEKRLKRITIKEELVKLTGDYKKAIILQQFIYWSERIKDVDKFLKEEKQRLANHNISEGDATIDFQNGWIYKKAEELSEETMLGLTKSNIGTHVKYLVEHGWLDSRRNPKYKWDKTLQYRVNIVKIQQDLQLIGYNLEGYPLTEVPKQNTEVSEIEHRSAETELHSSEIELHSSEIEHQSHQNRTAIPEITTETTSEITSKEEVIVIDDEKGMLVQEIGERPLYIFPTPKETYLYYFKAEANKEQLTVLDGCLSKGIDISTIAWAMRETLEKGKEWPYCMKILERFKERNVLSAEEAEKRKREYNKGPSKKEDGLKESFYAAHERIFAFSCNEFQNQLLIDYIDKDGMDEELIIYAMERAALNMTGYKFQYISRIIDEYASAKIKTVKQAEAYENELAKKKMVSNQGRGKQVRTDEVPAHIVEQMERQQRMAAGEFNPSVGKASAEDTDAKKRRVQELLKEMGEVKA